MSLKIGNHTKRKHNAQPAHTPYTPFAEGVTAPLVSNDMFVSTPDPYSAAITEATAQQEFNPYAGFDTPMEFPSTPTPTPQVTMGNPYSALDAVNNSRPGESGFNSPSSTEGSYLHNLAKVESADSWTAHNKGSGAYGKFQFIPSTEKAYAKKLGMSIKEARTPAGQMAMVDAFTNDNRKGLVRAGIEPTQENLYMAHQQGLGGAIKMLRGGQAKMINLTSNGVSNTREWKAKFGKRFN